MTALANDDAPVVPKTTIAFADELRVMARGIDVHTEVKRAKGTTIIAMSDVSSKFALPIAQAAKEVRSRGCSRRRARANAGSREATMD